MTPTTVALSHPDLTQAVVGLRRAADQLERRRATTEHQVDVLLDGGWSGAAAASYREGWEDWRTGCAEVIGALSTMADLVDTARADLDAADVSSRDAHGAVSARLAERLTGRRG